MIVKEKKWPKSHKMLDKANIKKAQLYLKGEKISFEKITKCVSELYDAQKFNYARRLLARLAFYKYKLDDKLLSKWAISTYKDDDQPGETRFEEAITILKRVYGDIPEKINNSRIAGNLGSIYKQKWRFDNQEIWLKKALCFLDRGYYLWLTAWKEVAPELKINPRIEVPKDSNFLDQGYCAINAAYVCDTLAARLREISKEDETLKAISEQLVQRAKVIRQDIVDYCDETETFFKQRWSKDKNEEHSKAWFYTTWAEALMGLSQGKCAKAINLIKAARSRADFDPNSWSGESAAHQIANWIAEDHFGGDQKYIDNAHALLKTVSGATTFGSRNDRIGLALSGGGFRAALFHIGVLARLAEQDLLRKVDVISCVSGGSIIGAYYYLKVRNLLQKTSDEALGKDDYIKLVHEIEAEFVEDVNWDLRSKLFANPFSNLRMAFDPNYSRTSRLADLYEERLYKNLLTREAMRSAKETEKKIPEPVDSKIYMSDLIIRPMGPNGKQIDVSPNKVNWKRENKIPMLVLNATTLNTGHCWQFTASWMGEPPSYINNETDALPTLRRMYYREAPKPHHKIRLAEAVAASSCVPGIFRPIVLRDIYQLASGKLIDVELVDGGVYDNQGINTLIEQECNMLIISDASGQLASVDEPKSGLLRVTGRTNAILQERIRASQLSDLNSRFASKILKGYLLMHLTKDLPSEVVNWRYCDDPYESNFRESDQAGNNILTNYGIRKNIQIAIARIRTDLDSFHEHEAFALMYSGYQMTDFEVQHGAGSDNIKKLDPAPDKTVVKERWIFQQIREKHDHRTEHEQLQKFIDTAAKVVKVYLVSSFVKILLT
ncbi:MAG: patatin-like phospholipase family protein, partial [Phycisphaerae bacterium]|nr:patatin-like phospholipase family protein [Saprospiraceae bacterium]